MSGFVLFPPVHLPHCHANSAASNVVLLPLVERQQEKPRQTTCHRQASKMLPACQSADDCPRTSLWRGLAEMQQLLLGRLAHSSSEISKVLRTHFFSLIPTRPWNITDEAGNLNSARLLSCNVMFLPTLQSHRVFPWTDSTELGLSKSQRLQLTSC